MIPQLFFSSQKPFLAAVLFDEQNKMMFRAADCARSLGYPNVSRAVRQLVDSDYIVRINDGSARNNEVLYIREPGLYQLLFRSTKPEAIAFQKWLLEDVLPSINRSRCYATEEVKEELTNFINLVFLYEEKMTEVCKLSGLSTQALGDRPKLGEYACKILKLLGLPDQV
ncbi:MAG: Bro-N domain-containing protein [Leptolyngbyaceae cyanobacterium SL_5_14]|nr:Bro-N domain-containing protein [Leptolyngbyaceae cyanobacterium SL_5_14]